MTALLHDYGGALLRAVAIHTGYVLTAVLIGFVLGLALGILLSRVHRWAVIVMPLLSIFQTIPGLVFIGVLLAVSVFLISNTINVAASFRKNVNEIMRYIGATNYMIRAPFVVEGIVMGLMGAAVPLAAMYFLYLRSVSYLTARFQILSRIFQFLPLSQIFPYMAAVGGLLGLGIGFFASFFTIRKHLKV